MDASDVVLAFTDYETSGLDADKLKPLELAIVLTDTDLNVIAKFSQAIYQDELFLTNMDQWCIDTHSANGLLDEIRVTHPDQTAELVEKNAISFLDQYANGKRIIIAGFSVHFDRFNVMERHMPELTLKYFYRHFDLSVLRMTRDFWEWCESEENFSKDDVTHRALQDCMDTIACAQEFKDELQQLKV